jgi:hypothetical protein
MALVGRVLRLEPGEWRYGDRALTLRVSVVLTEISGWYDGNWCWLRGDELGPDGEAVQSVSALANVDALPTA